MGKEQLSMDKYRLININLLHHILTHSVDYYCPYVDSKIIVFTLMNEWLMLKWTVQLLLNELFIV